MKNTGLHGGDEVAELYLIPTHTNVSPSLALQGFKRLHIAPGASEHVVFRLDPRLLSQVDSQGNRAVAPGTKEPVPFSSPWRTVTIDRIDDASSQLQFSARDGNFEFSIPLSTLGLNPSPGQAIRADIGLLRGSGFSTLQRVYWNNKATGITADVPSEAELTPALWGKWEFVVVK